MSYQLPAETRDEHPYFMHDEVHAQPEALRRALAQGQAEDGAALEGVARVYTTGCGTSYHAAMVAEYWLRALGISPDAKAVEGFELTAGDYSFDGPTAVIAFSQSGEKGATLTAIGRAKTEGANTIAITGEPESRLAREVDVALWSGLEKSISWAHTISYTTALTAFLRFALELAPAHRKESLLPQLERVPEAYAAFLRDEDPIRRLAARYKDHSRIFLIGSGGNLATAMEGSLKLRETSYAGADALSAEYFLHGPISSLDSDALLIAIAPPGPDHARTLDVVRAAKTIGAATLALGEVGDDELAGAASDFVELPPLATELTPLLYVLPLQVFAYWRAVGLGLNPDLLRRDVPAYLQARRGYDL